MTQIFLKQEEDNAQVSLYTNADFDGNLYDSKNTTVTSTSLNDIKHNSGKEYHVNHNFLSHPFNMQCESLW